MKTMQIFLFIKYTSIDEGFKNPEIVRELKIIDGSGNESSVSSVAYLNSIMVK